MYDPQLGRFHTQDRFAEKYYSLTPYQYAANNPISNIDINGDSVWVTTQYRTDNKGNITGIHNTIHMTGKVLDETANPSRARDVANGLNKRLNSQTGSYKDNNGLTISTSFEANITVANSMEDVETRDHLLVIVDNVEGKGDPTLGGGDAIGLAAEPGKIGYVQAGSTEAMVNTAFHEGGHMLGLAHPKVNDSNNPMSYTGFGANFSTEQLKTLTNGYRNGTLNPNLGKNSALMRDHFPGFTPYGDSSNTRPFRNAPSPNKLIPRPLVNKNR
jgi:uncharacterized protein RhaS with RHS repeats